MGFRTREKVVNRGEKKGEKVGGIGGEKVAEGKKRIGGRRRKWKKGKREGVVTQWENKGRREWQVKLKDGGYVGRKEKPDPFGSFAFVGKGICHFGGEEAKKKGWKKERGTSSLVPFALATLEGEALAVFSLGGGKKRGKRDAQKEEQKKGGERKSKRGRGGTKGPLNSIKKHEGIKKKKKKSSFLKHPSK